MTWICQTLWSKLGCDIMYTANVQSEEVKWLPGDWSIFFHRQLCLQPKNHHYKGTFLCLRMINIVTEVNECLYIYIKSCLCLCFQLHRMVRTAGSLHFTLHTEDTRQRKEDKFRGIVYSLGFALYFCESCNKGGRFTGIFRHLRSSCHKERADTVLTHLYGSDAIITESTDVSPHANNLYTD